MGGPGFPRATCGSKSARCPKPPKNRGWSTVYALVVVLKTARSTATGGSAANGCLDRTLVPLEGNLQRFATYHRTVSKKIKLFGGVVQYLWFYREGIAGRVQPSQNGWSAPTQQSLVFSAPEGAK